MPADDPVKLKHARLLNGQELVVEFTDGKIAVFTLEKLLALAPNRVCVSRAGEE